MGYLNLGHFAFYGIGAYAFSLMLVAGQALPLCFLAAIAVPALAAAVVSFPLFRLKGDYFAFATLAMVPLCELLANNLSGLTKGSEGINLPPTYVLFPAYAMATALVLLTVATTLLLTRLAVRLRAQDHPQRRAGGRGDRRAAVPGQDADPGSERRVRRPRRCHPGLAVQLHRSVHDVQFELRAGAGGDGIARRLRPALGAAGRCHPARRPSSSSCSSSSTCCKAPSTDSPSC